MQFKSTEMLVRTMALGLLLATAMSACVIATEPRHYAAGVVLVAPPSPREEVIGVAPVPGYVWIGGYWNWVGNSHQWVPGYWAAPHPGHVWVAHQWVRQGGGWRLVPGHWAREGR
jgi:hypothetical protein